MKPVKVKKGDSGISVIICCYNSAGRLTETLRHLAAQKTLSTLLWEIILIDNASTDNTAAVANKFWNYSGIKNVKLKIFEEKKPGHIFARMTGVEKAQYKYIVFCDDDNWLNENYLEQGYSIMQSNNKIGALGGQSFAASDTEFPQWFDYWKPAYAVGQQNEKSGYVKRGYIYGAGLITRKDLFIQTVNSKYPSLLSGRKGNATSSGDDYEYCLRLILKNYKIFYSEKLIYRHFIAANRLTIEYRDKLVQSHNESNNYINKYLEAIRIKNYSRVEKFRMIIASIRNITKSFINKKEPNKFFLRALYLFTGISYKQDNADRIIKHFYDC